MAGAKCTSGRLPSMSARAAAAQFLHLLTGAGLISLHTGLQHSSWLLDAHLQASVAEFLYGLNCCTHPNWRQAAYTLLHECWWRSAACKYMAKAWLCAGSCAGLQRPEQLQKAGFKHCSTKQLGFVVEAPCSNAPGSCRCLHLLLYAQLGGSLLSQAPQLKGAESNMST